MNSAEAPPKLNNFYNPPVGGLIKLLKSFGLYNINVISIF